MVAPVERFAETRDGFPASRGYRLRFEGLLPIAFALISLAFSYFLVPRLGLALFAAAVGGLLGGSLLAIVSFRNLMLPFGMWLLAIFGLKFLVSIRTPLLPDLFLDRIAMLWLGMVFLVKFVATKRSLRGPFTLDILLLCHAMYIFVRVILQGGEFINPWIQSVLMPYSAYLLGKNIITNERRLRVIWLLLLALAVYYSITLIAEKYKITALVVPKDILNHQGFRGRSIGPFKQPGVTGTTLGMMLPIFLYFVATARSLPVRIVMLAGFLAGLAGLYFTYTRGSWLAGAVAVLVTALLNRRQYLKVIAPAVVLAPLLAISLIGVRSDKFAQERFENDETVGSRVATAITAIKVWRDNPVLGVGYFQYRYARDAYIDPITVPGLGTIRFIQFRHNNIHDIYLGPLAEDGLLGMGLQFAIYYFILRTFLRKYRWRARGDPFAVYALPVFGGVFIGYLVGGLAFDYRFFSAIATLFYMTAGIQEGMQPMERRDVS